MGFWWYLLVMDLVVPGIVVYFGWRFVHNPPEEINGLYGYRTARSMKNRETWQFAHGVCGRFWFRWGLVLIPLTILGLVPAWGKPVSRASWIGLLICLVQLLFLAGAIAPTERALKKTFDHNGIRRKKET